MIKLFKTLLDKLPYIRGLKRQIDLYNQNSAYPPGHYYSPIMNKNEIIEREQQIWSTTKTVNEIDFNVDAQLALLKNFEFYYSDLPFDELPNKQHRYYYNNEFYLYTDAIILYSFLRHFKPSNVIEIGSGFSSALMLDVNNLFLNNTTNLTFIEPFTERLKGLLRDDDKNNVVIIEKFIQDIDIEKFKKLSKDDILFVDSTHVSKTGSDLNCILFEILPTLASGVIIHFHDVFNNFEYPKGWVFGGRNWNEDYLIRAFLMNNSKYEILFFNDYMHTKHPSSFTSLPLTYKNFGGSIWLRKK